MIEGFETVMFRSKFDSWPHSAEVAVSEDGRGKVAGQSFPMVLCSYSYVCNFVYI